MQLLFSRNGLFFCELKPTRRQSSCSCSLINFMISITACETDMRLIAASRRSCSVIWRCCCKLEIIMSITAVSDRPIVKGVVEQPSENKRPRARRPRVTLNNNRQSTTIAKHTHTESWILVLQYLHELMEWLSNFIIITVDIFSLE